MVEMTPLWEDLLIGLLGLLGAGVLCCLVRAILGPRYTDRVVALSTLCTLVILMVCILSYLLEQSWLLDVAIVYGLLSLLAVAILSRVTVSHHRRRKGEEP